MNALSGRLAEVSIAGLTLLLVVACGSPAADVPASTPTPPPAQPAPVRLAAPPSPSPPVPTEVDAPSGSGPVFGKLSTAADIASGCVCWEPARSEEAFFRKTGAKKATIHIDGKDYSVTLLSSSKQRNARTDKMTISGSNLDLDITWQESKALGEGLTYDATFTFVGDGMVTSSTLSCGGSCM